MAAVSSLAAGLLVPIAGATTAHAAEDVGYVHSPDYAGVTGVSDATTYHVQSKAWFQDNSWWSVMFEPTTSPDGHWTIHKLDRATQTWSDAGQPVVDDETRKRAHLDVLSDGSNLYVVSSLRATSMPVKVYTFSYSGGVYTKTSTDTTAASGVQYATIAKDSNDQLWVAFTQDNAVRYMTSDDGFASIADVPMAGHTPQAGAAGAAADSDDVASVVSFGGTGGDRVGVLWSRSEQSDGGFFFAVHNDGDAATTWATGTPETVWSGEFVGDNHVSLKVASNGDLYVAVKSSFDRKFPKLLDDPLIAVLKRATDGTSWSGPNTVSTVGDDETRPMLVLDEGSGQAEVFVTNPFDHDHPTDGGDIVRRFALLTDLAHFNTASLFMHNETQQAGDDTAVPPVPVASHLNDATDSKAPASATSGIIVLASDKYAKLFMHNCLGAACPEADPASTSTSLSSSPNPSVVGNAVTLTATVTGGTGPTGSVLFKEGTTTIAGPSDVNAGVATASVSNLTAGTHSLTAEYTPNSSSFLGSTSSPISQVVQAATPPPTPGAPVAAFTTDRTDGRAPLDVQFTDTSTGGPTSWAWDFGDGTTSSEQSPLHTYVSSGTYTAKLTVANANGSTSATTAIIVSPSGNRFMPVTPTRVLTGKKLGPNSFTTITLKTPPGSNAVALNVTATKVTKGTVIAVCANDQTTTDCVTHGAVRAYRHGSTVGFTISELDANDAIKIYNSAGTATVNLDVQGWFVGRPQQTTYYTGLAPAKRLLTAKSVGHKMYKLAIPAALRPPGTVAVGLNITASNPTASTKIAVCGRGQTRSECAHAPDLFSSGQRTVTNHVVARLRAGGTVKLLNTRGTTRLTVDIQGSYSTVDAAALFRPNPQRRLVTARAMAPKSAFTFTQRSLPPGTTAVVLRVTVSSPTANGSLSVCQGGVKKRICKATSVLAVQRHRTTTNVVVVQVGTGGTIKFYNAAGKNKLTVDAIGSFGRN